MHLRSVDLSDRGFVTVSIVVKAEYLLQWPSRSTECNAAIIQLENCEKKRFNKQLISKYRHFFTSTAKARERRYNGLLLMLIF